MSDNAMTAVILAGGHAECLRVKDDYVPKILLPLDGRPLLEHQLSWLSRSGFDSVVLCLGYKAEAVRAHFGDGSRFGVKLFYSVEETPLGTAGMVKALGPASLAEEVLVLPGDVYPDTDFAKMREFHRAHKPLATLAVHDCGAAPEHRDCRRAVLGPSRLIIDFPVPPPKGPGTGVSPLWIIHRSLLHLAGDCGPSDFLRDVFPSAVRRGEPLAGYHETGTLIDIDTSEQYAGLQKLFRSKIPR